MSKNTITIFDEERITHKGENPDVKVLLDKISNDGIHIKAEVNLKDIILMMIVRFFKLTTIEVLD